MGRPSRVASTLIKRDPEHLSAAAQRYAVLPPGHPQGYADCFDAFVADVYEAIETGDARRRAAAVRGRPARRPPHRCRAALRARGALGRRVHRSCGGRGMSESAPLLEVRGITKQYPGVQGAEGRGLRRPRRRGALPARPQRRRQVDADQVRVGRGRPDRGRDPLQRRAAARRRAVGSRMAFGVGDDLPGARPGRGPARRREHLPRPRAAPARPARPRPDARARRPRCSSASTTATSRPDMFVRDAAPRRAADRLDRPRALAQREAADHGRAVLDPRRRRGRDPVRRRPPAHRRRRRRHLHLAPPRRDPAHRRPRHGALRRRARSPPACRPTRRAASWWRRWSAARSTSCSPTRATATTDEVVLDVRGVSGSPRVKECSFQVHAGEVVGIGGLVGAGRSRAAAPDLRHRPPDTGEVYRRRQEAAGRPARRGDRAAASASRPRTASPRACCSAGA